MRRGSRRRHPVLELAVFAVALLMAVFLACELWRRWSAAPLAEHAAARYREDVPPPHAVGARQTERAVTTVPPLRLSRIERRKPKSAAVPAPR